MENASEAYRELYPEIIEEKYPWEQPEEDSAPSPANANPSTTATLPTSWHPKLTTYRLLVITTTLGFSITKAVLSYQGRTIVPITLEWLFSTGIFLIFFALDIYQDRVKAPALPWFFQVDLVYFFWSHICALFRVQNPAFYSTEEQNRRPSNVRGARPPIRGYDILVMSTTIVFGVTKSVMAYAGYNTGMTTVEWVGSGVVGVGMYWLGLYESNPGNKMPYLFSTDYLRGVKTYTKTSVSITLQLAVIAFSVWWSYICSGWLVSLPHILRVQKYSGIPFYEKALLVFALGGTLSGMMMGVATILAAGLAVAAVLMSRFRAVLLEHNINVLLNHTSPLFVLLTYISILTFLLPLTVMFTATSADLISRAESFFSATLVAVIMIVIFIISLVVSILTVARGMGRYVRELWERALPWLRRGSERPERRASMGV